MDADGLTYVPLRPRHRTGAEGEEDNPSTMTHIPACQRCNKKKLRCSRDLPTCKRCRNIAAICKYPQPPERKLLAPKRARSAKARAQRESESGTAGSFHQTSPAGFTGHRKPEGSRQSGKESRAEDYRASTPPLNAVLTRTTLPSPEVAIFLIEIFFSRLYNASLLFHKASFLSDYHANKIPDFVALSIYALASIFLGTSQDDTSQHGDEDGVDLGISMVSTSDLISQGFEWATAASQRVLLQADNPRLETIQACQNLAIYWFSRGQTQRTHIHAHTAYRIARLLNLHLPYSKDATSDSCEVLDELKRRCFWACWVTMCISQDNAEFKTTPWQEAVNIPLPSDEESFSLGKPISVECYDSNGEIKPIQSLSSRPLHSTMGELVKLINFWWEIQNFVKHGPKPGDSSGRVATLLELDRRLGIIFENFHPVFRYQPTISFTSPTTDRYRLFSMHSLYRLCVCVLHTSIVPLFSEAKSDPPVSKRLVRISVEQSVKHAAQILDMASDFLTTRPDISRIPSITGYAMFVACTVHFKTLVAQKRLQQLGTSRFKSAILILERLKEYWVTSQDLWAGLKNLFASKNINIDLISKSDNWVNTSADERDADLENIVSHEGTPQDVSGTDIYTYIVSEEGKTSSPRPSPDARSSPGRLSAQFKASPPSMGVTETMERLSPSQQIQNYHEPQKANTDERTFGLPHQHHQLHNRDPGPRSQSQSTYTQSNLAHTSTFTTNPPDNRQSFNAISPGFVPMGAVAEEYQLHGSRANVSYVPLEDKFGAGGQTMDDLMNTGGYLATGMDVDGINFWWDQSFGAAFEADPALMNPVLDGAAAYYYQTYPYN